VNFLAHFHCAWPNTGLIAGGLEGDYCKGPLRGALHADIEAGVKLHRAIDAFTDTHPVVVALRREFPDDLRRYAGILIDISFDHFLTKHWSRYSAMSLEAFTLRVYQVLDEHMALLSVDCQKMAARLQQYDVLNRYGDWSAVAATATRVGERFRRGNPLLHVQQSLDPLEKTLESAFLTFYPQLLAYTGPAASRH